MRARVRKRRELGVDQLSQRHACSGSGRNEFLGVRQGVQPADEGLERALVVLAPAERAGGDGLHDGQQILGAMLQLANQQRLPGLRLFAFRYVASDRVNAERLAVLAEAQPGLDVERHALLGALRQHLQLVLRGGLAGELALQQFFLHRVELLGDEAADRRSDHLLRRVPQDALHGGIDRRESPLQIERGDDVVGVLDEGAVALLAGLQRPLGSFPLGDIDGESDAAHGLAFRSFAR